MKRHVLAIGAILAATSMGAYAGEASSARLDVTGAGLTGELSFDSGQTSPVRTHVFGLDSWEAIEGAELVVEGQPEHARAWILLRAQGVALAPGGSFLRLPDDFRPGQPIELEIRVQPAAANDGVSTVSVVEAEHG